MSGEVLIPSVKMPETLVGEAFEIQFCENMIKDGQPGIEASINTIVVCVNGSVLSDHCLVKGPASSFYILSKVLEILIAPQNL